MIFFDIIITHLTLGNTTLGPGSEHSLACLLCPSWIPSHEKVFDY
jgi:hypothetical protein